MREVLLPLSILLPHEEVVEERVKELLASLKEEGQKKPILVERNTFIILDGHHRVEGLRRLGKSSVKAVLVDYRDKRILVKSWREGERVTKRDVLRIALLGRRFPPKTSRHVMANKSPSQ